VEALASTDPQMVGRYRLEARLGAGGMGRVFLGRSPGGRAVAVKVIRPELAADAEFRRRFAAEVAAARRVGGFHTAPVVDADPDGDPPWLVTAYVPGPSLAKVLTEHGALPEEALRGLAAGLAEALEAIHRAGLVHRDFKPSNILLAEDGPRVIDFGIARALDGTTLTRTGGTVGTPGFMAPEQITGDQVGPPADVFAFGTVLSRAAGVAPFGKGPAHVLLYRIVYQEPQLDGLPGWVREVVAECLDKDPARRPTAEELLSRLALPAGEADAETVRLPERSRPASAEGTPTQPPASTVAPDQVRLPQGTGQPGEARFPHIRRNVAYTLGECLFYLLLVGIGAFLLKEFAPLVPSAIGLDWVETTGWRGALKTVFVLLAACVGGLLALCGVFMLSPPSIRASLGPTENVIDQTGITQIYGKRFKHTDFYPWERIGQLQVRHYHDALGAPKDSWGLLMRFVPDAQPPIFYRWERDAGGKQTGWMLILSGKEVQATREEVEAAVRRFAGSLWEAPDSS